MGREAKAVAATRCEKVIYQEGNKNYSRRRAQNSPTKRKVNLWLLAILEKSGMEREGKAKAASEALQDFAYCGIMMFPNNTYWETETAAHPTSTCPVLARLWARLKWSLHSSMSKSDTACLTIYRLVEAV